MLPVAAISITIAALLTLVAIERDQKLPVLPGQVNSALTREARA